MAIDAMPPATAPELSYTLQFVVRNLRRNKTIPRTMNTRYS